MQYKQSFQCNCGEHHPLTKKEIHCIEQIPANNVLIKNLLDSIDAVPEIKVKFQNNTADIDLITSFIIQEKESKICCVMCIKNQWDQKISALFNLLKTERSISQEDLGLIDANAVVLRSIFNNIHNLINYFEKVGPSIDDLKNQFDLKNIETNNLIKTQELIKKMFDDYLVDESNEKLDLIIKELELLKSHKKINIEFNATGASFDVVGGNKTDLSLLKL